MPEYIDSYYARTLAVPGDRPTLDGTLEADVVVIGGGLAGLATALDLVERGRRVVVLERHAIGWGASGRNGGFVSVGYPNGIPALVDRVGLAEAKIFYSLSRMGHSLVRERIARYQIACGPIQDGAFRCNMAEARESLAGFCEFMARNFDAQYEYWPAARLRTVLATTRYSDAFFNPYTFTVHPLNLARGLADAIEHNGGKVFERSGVTGLERHGDGYEVVTSRGRVRAPHVVIACGGYVNPWLNRTVAMATVPIATFVMTTEPLGDKLNNAMASPYAVSDIKVATNYYRPLADGRLLWGGRVLAWEPSVHRVARRLRSDMAAFYPGIADARIEVAWGGLMPMLRHRMPFVGEIERGLWVATGFGGLGLALTTTAGRLLAAAIVEGDDEWRRFARFGLPFAGGKLGRIPAQFIYWRNQAAARFGHGRRP
jgi:gamma-glutamylputrescine oxidase